MEHKTEQLATYLAARKELETLISQKLDAIKTQVFSKKSENSAEDLQILIMVNDELDDVLLNWEVSHLSARPKTDDFDDDEDY